MPFERWLYAWRARWRALFDRGRADRELDDELRDHVARETAALRARGVSPADARRQTLASLGGLASAQDRVRAVRFGALAEQVLQDVRHGLRLLVRNPGFTAATVVTLTVGSGQRPAFSRSSTPFSSSRRRSPEPGRLVPLWETDPTDGDRATEVAPANFLDWRAQATSFEEVAAIVPYSFDATGASEPEVLYASLVTEGFFRPRADVPARRVPRRERRRRSDRRLLAAAVRRGPRCRRGVARARRRAAHRRRVLAPDFELALERGQDAQARDLYAPKTIEEWATFRRGGGWWQVMARLRPEASVDSARAEMHTVAARLAADHPRTNEGVGARVIRLQSRQVENVRPTLLLLQGFVLLVLLIALPQRRQPSAGAEHAAHGGVAVRTAGQAATPSRCCSRRPPRRPSSRPPRRGHGSARGPPGQAGGRKRDGQDGRDVRRSAVGDGGAASANAQLRSIHSTKRDGSSTIITRTTRWCSCMSAFAATLASSAEA